MIGLALRAARRAHGRTWPNPMVGAVVAKGDRVLGIGYHHGPGMAHAEVEALAGLGAAARGADLYVTLEPCHCFGRTGPCSQAILAAGLRRVFVGTLDPNPRESGRGIAVLRRAGLEVVTGIRQEECRRLNEVYNLFIARRRPFVQLKAALSLDGRMAAWSGDARWISGLPSRRRAHRLRAGSDAVLVGVGTVLQDDPALDVRLVKGRNPAVVVLDSSLSIPPEAKLLRIRREAPVWIFTTRTAPKPKARRLEGRGARIVRVPGRNGRLDLRAVLADLFRRGVYRLLVEGGATVNGSFLLQRLVDRLELHLAPCLLGSDAVPFARWKGPARVAWAPRLADARWTRHGVEWACSGTPRWPKRGR
jgi:diaminohydroxyphosphoribosylaminopyrimidine deaminase/5-amino-6-(5-phosphoribosylamino)uracil reductase